MPAGNCPECNRSIAESVAANARFVWNKDELRGLRTAVTVLAIMGIVGVAHGMLFRPIWWVFVDFLHVRSMVVARGFQVENSLEELIVALAVGYLIRHKKFRDRWDGAARLAVRLAIVAIVAFQAQSFFFGLLFPSGYRSVATFLCEISAYTLATFSTVAMYWFLFRAFEEMAVRMRSGLLAVESGWIRRIYCPLLILEFGAFLVRFIVTRPWLSQWTFYVPGQRPSAAIVQSIVLILSIVQILGMAVAGLYLIFFQIRFRFLLSRLIAASDAPS